MYRPFIQPSKNISFKFMHSPFIPFRYIYIYYKFMHSPFLQPSRNIDKKCMYCSFINPSRKYTSYIRVQFFY